MTPQPTPSTHTRRTSATPGVPRRWILLLFPLPQHFPSQRLQLCPWWPAALRRPRVNGSRSEYVALIARMHAVGMVDFTARPLAVNGVFAVAKDKDADRLIIDAQPANRIFVDSPHVDLPNPSHLVQLQLPPGAAMYTCKSDLSNFYHHLGLMRWLQPYLALPPLSPAELTRIGLPSGAAYPMCTTTPMGFSHAVFWAQAAHEHVVYSTGALLREHSLLRLASPLVTADRALHGIVIDDLWQHCLDRSMAERTFARVLAAYGDAGFLVKDSKVVRPTTQSVKVIGFDIDGVAGSIRPPPDSAISLRRGTLSLLRLGIASSRVLAHIIGRWTWVMMLRRPCLAVLQQCYRYCRVAWGRHFRLWLSVRQELYAQPAASAGRPPSAAHVPPRHCLRRLRPRSRSGGHSPRRGPARSPVASVLQPSRRHAADTVQL